MTQLVFATLTFFVLFPLPFFQKMVLLVSDYTCICHSSFCITVLPNLVICTWWPIILVDQSQYFAYCQSCCCLSAIFIF